MSYNYYFIVKISTANSQKSFYKTNLELYS